MIISSIRQPGDVVNEVFSENIEILIHMCLEAGDDPSSLIEETKHELQVTKKMNMIVFMIKFIVLENGC